VRLCATDYIFIAAPKLAPLPAPGHALSFPFGYIVPTWPARRHIMKRYYPGEPEDIPQTGNAPVLMRFDDFAKVCPRWVELTAKLEKDEEAKEAFGWVREMYAYSIAAALACIAHYTWGAVLREVSEVSGSAAGLPGPAAGKEVWRWDKREYAAGQYGDKCARLERITAMPPWSDQARLVLQDGQPVGRGKYDLLALMVSKFNEAVDEVNAVNGGVPAGLQSWEEADRVSQPSAASVEARAGLEKRERAIVERKEREAKGR